jgi:dihydrofolate synthase / folylpolyglutamate synthase
VALIILYKNSMGIKHDIEKYHRAVDFLEGLVGMYGENKVHINQKLKIFKDYLHKIGDPHTKCKVIHVAGTAGKGTVASLIHASLVKAGYKTGLYMSPHTTTLTERIKLNDRYIAAEALYNIIDRIKPAMHEIDIPPNFFGMTLAIAFKYFAEEKCDYVVLEALLGGEHDHTNVVPQAEVTIITNVGYDHTDVLGKTLKQIATQKAGIIKKDTQFLTAEDKPRALKVLRERCEQKKVPFTHIKPNGDSYTDINIRLAQAAINKLGVKQKITKSIVAKSAKLPCRQEIIQTKPTVMLDGAHNPAKIKAITSTVKKMKKPLKYLIIGMSANKDWRSCLQEIVPHARYIYLTKYLSSRRSTVSPLKMKKYINKHFPKKKVELFWDATDALDAALNKAKKKDFILVTGSMYLAGELRAQWIPEDTILRYRSSF